MSAPAKWEYLKVMHARYLAEPRKDQGRLLDEFCRTTGYRRKYALRLLNGPGPADPIDSTARPGKQHQPGDPVGPRRAAPSLSVHTESEQICLRTSKALHAFHRMAANLRVG